MITGALDLVVGDPFTRVWRDPAGKPAFYAEAWGATGGTGEYAWDKSGFRLICRAKTLLTFLEAQDACLVLLVKAQKYLKDAGTTDGKFAVSTLLMTIMPLGGIEFVLQIPDNARTAIETLGRDEQHDFVRRFLRRSDWQLLSGAFDGEALSLRCRSGPAPEWRQGGCPSE